MRGKALDYILRVIKDTMETMKGKKVTTVTQEKLNKISQSLSTKMARSRPKKNNPDYREIHESVVKRSIAGKSKSDVTELSDFAVANRASRSSNFKLEQRRKRLKKNLDAFRRRD